MTDEETYEIYIMNKRMRNEGLTEKERVEKLGIKVSALRRIVSLYSKAERNDKIIRAQKLKEHGYSNAFISEKMGINESSVRSLLKQTPNYELNIVKEYRKC